MHADERRRGIRRDSSLDHQMHCGEVYLISPVFAEALIGGDRRASAVSFIFALGLTPAPPQPWASNAFFTNSQRTAPFSHQTPTTSKRASRSWRRFSVR